MKYLSIAILSALLINGCATTGSSENTNYAKGELESIPNWILSPSVKNGVAESACVPWSGNITIDRDEASHIARDRLAKQIDIRAAGMTKAFANKTTTSKGLNTGTNFESVSRQIFDKTLSGSRPTKAGLFTIDKKKQFCVMVEINPVKTKELYKGIVKASGAQLSADDDAILLEQFKAWKAQGELDKTLKNK